MDLLFAAVLIITLSIALLYLGQHLGIPSIVGFLIIGMLAGPYGFAIITNQTAIDLLANIGILLLLFTIGLEFSFQQLLRSWRTVLIGGLIQVCITIIAITAITAFLGMPFAEALVFGFIVSLSSTAIVMKVLQEKEEVDTLKGRTLFGILIFQDLAIIPMVLILPLLLGNGGPAMDRLPLQIAKVVFILLLIIVLAHWVIPRFLFYVAQKKNRELFFVSIAGICIVITWLVSQAGLSFTLGAFAAGLIIGESDYNIDALGHIIPFRDVFASIFFLSIGMLLNTSTVLNAFSYIALIVGVIIAVKILTGALSAAALGMPPRICVFAGLALCQIGEFSFVLAKEGRDAALIPATTYQLFLAGAIITMALTPFFMNASPKVVDLLYRIYPQRAVPEKPVEYPDTDQPLSDHIIIAGYGITGRSVAQAATIAGIPWMVIELDPEVIRRERSPYRPHFIFGDATLAEVLEHAGIRSARMLLVTVSEEEAIPRIVHTARNLAPQVHIFVRTRHVREAQYLLDLGADEIISEEYVTARTIFFRALKNYHIAENGIARILEQWDTMAKVMFTKHAGTVDQSSGAHLHAREMHVHAFTVEQGSRAEGKTLAVLDLRNRFGTQEIGLRSGNTTSIAVPGATLLQKRDVLIFFITDQKADEIAPLFSGP